MSLLKEEVLPISCIKKLEESDLPCNMEDVVNSIAQWNASDMGLVALFIV